jgi:tetratricopeptide (TPR) repeat protein
LGNFRGLFPFYRAASVIQQEVWHPESDWLWLAAEMGWLAVGFAATALLSCLWSAVPMEKGTQRRLRCAALASAVAGALHGLIDVPGHRLGSLMTIALALALARRDTLPAPDARGAGAFWRLAGLALVGGALWWRTVPDEAPLAEALSHAGRFAEAGAVASHALERAPLNWRLYFTRAGARACAGKPLEALGDFRRVRFLEPHLAFSAWKEALQREPAPGGREIYQVMWAAAPDDADSRRALLELAKGRPDLELAWFLAAPPAEARRELDRISNLQEFWDADQMAAFRMRAAALREISPLP